MSTVTIKPGPITGTTRAISSKSDAHRALICAALCERPTVFAPFTPSNDIDATLSCLTALGAGVDYGADGGLTLTPGRLPESAELDCGESGSTLRFLLPVAAALGVCARFTGHGRLPERSIAPLVSAMRGRGARIFGERLPLEVSGGLEPGVFSITGGESSQYISGLLFALPLLAGDSEIEIAGALSSAGYVEMTLAALGAFGVEAVRIYKGFTVPGGRGYRSPGRAVIDGDWSNSAFFLTAGALGAPVTVRGLRRDSLQGDRLIETILKDFGAVVHWEENDLTVSPGELHAADVDVDQIPDLLPALAVLACAARGETRLYNAARLRDKESDRLRTTAAMLNALGAEVREEPDALVIKGRGTLAGGRADGAGDHRIVMAAALASVISRGDVIIGGSGAVAKSYPRFFEDFNWLKVSGKGKIRQ